MTIHTTIDSEYAMKPQQRPYSRPPPPIHPPPSSSSPNYDDAKAAAAAAETNPHDDIRAWLDGVVMDEEHKPLVNDVLHVLSGMQQQQQHHPLSESHKNTTGLCTNHVKKNKKQQQTEKRVTVRTIGPGFMGRAPPLASTEFFANVVVVAILLLFAPGFTLLAVGVFFTSRVAERWGES